MTESKPYVSGQEMVSGGPLGKVVLLYVQGTDSSNHLTLEEIRSRAICHFLVSRIPTEGLQETFETLVEIGDFFSTRPSGPPALPEPRERLQAKLGRTYDRPTFTLSEE